MACRNGGVVSIPGVYGGFLDKMPIGSFMNRSLTLKTGQTHVQRYLKQLLDRVQKGEIDPSVIITHRLPLDEAPEAYKMFRDKQDECVMVVLKPCCLAPVLPQRAVREHGRGQATIRRTPPLTGP
jgi:threonine dehydrogenase-like Zn-dependent dehydrogenase